MRQRLLVLGLLGMVLFWAAVPAAAAEFSAQVVTRTALGEITGTVYFQGENVRQESALQGTPTVAIIRGAEKKLWVILPASRTYVEMPFTAEGVPGLLTIPRSGKDMRLMGQETVNGYRCDKYEAVMTVQGRTLSRTVWVARDLQVPIKTLSADGSLASEFKNIKPEKLDPSLFLLPAGYEKLSLPGALDPGAAGGGRKRRLR